MIIIKRFIDRVSASEGKTGTNVILPMEEARMLRDEIAKLLSDNYNLNGNIKMVHLAKIGLLYIILQHRLKVIQMIQGYNLAMLLAEQDLLKLHGTEMMPLEIH